MNPAAEIIASRKHVLLDFDGPVCAVFGGLPDHQVADELRGLFEGELPEAVGVSRDPFDVLKYAAGAGAFAATVERQLRELEVRAVQVAPPTPGAAEVLEALHTRGVPVVIVSNNSIAAVAAYLEAHNMVDLVARISARNGANVDQLKPQPYLLLQAAESLGVAPDECVMIGDSASDIEAAQRTGSRSIGYANKPGKRRRFEQYGLTAIIEHMAELLDRALA